MRIDLHIHTNYSSCSNLALEDYISSIKKIGLKVVTITDHGTIKGCSQLDSALPEVTVIYGIEVKAQEGDFLIFSEDIDYLNTLNIHTKSVSDIKNDSNTAIVWAHPRLPSSYGWKSPVQKTSFLDSLMKLVDGIEIYNGNMLSQISIGLLKEDYFSDIKSIANEYNKACIGGSDSHSNGKLLLCWTEFPFESNSPIDYIRAIKNNNVKAGFNGEYLK